MLPQLMKGQSLIQKTSKRRKFDFVEMEGNNTVFMSIRMDETFPDITDLISQSMQISKSMSERVLSPANNGDHQGLHSHNCSDYCMEEKHSRLLESGLGHSALKKIHLDGVLDIDNQNCVDEATIREAVVPEFDRTEFEAKQVFITSKDGTQIPMIIVSKKDIVLDGLLSS